MSHYFEIDGIREKIFIINSLALSGESFSKDYAIGTRNDNSLYTQKEYWINTKSLVSNGVLEIAVKIRNAYESLSKSQSQEKIIICVENKEIANHEFVWLCNKIIHAKSVSMIPVGSHNNEEPLEWWDGEIRLKGLLQDKKTPWDISFNVVCWLKSCLSFLNLAENELGNMRNQSGEITRCI